MRERAKIMGAKLTVVERVEAGTEVELRLPASIAYSTWPESILVAGLYGEAIV